MPSTSTSTLSGDSPRSVAGRAASLPSAMAGRGKFSDGNSLPSAVATSVAPVACRDSSEMMSIGDSDSATVLSLTRVPVTIRVSRVFCGWVDCDCALAAKEQTVSATEIASESALELCMGVKARKE